MPIVFTHSIFAVSTKLDRKTYQKPNHNSPSTPKKINDRANNFSSGDGVVPYTSEGDKFTFKLPQNSQNATSSFNNASAEAASSVVAADSYRQLPPSSSTAGSNKWADSERTLTPLPPNDENNLDSTLVSERPLLSPTSPANHAGGNSNSLRGEGRFLVSLFF